MSHCSMFETSATDSGKVDTATGTGPGWSPLHSSGHFSDQKSASEPGFAATTPLPSLSCWMRFSSSSRRLEIRGDSMNVDAFWTGRSAQLMPYAACRLIGRFFTIDSASSAWNVSRLR